jgi:hypothetical protein
MSVRCPWPVCFVEEKLNGCPDPAVAESSLFTFIHVQIDLILIPFFCLRVRLYCDMMGESRNRIPRRTYSARQRHGKYISAVTNDPSPAGGLLERDVFLAGPSQFYIRNILCFLLRLGGGGYLFS